MREECSDRPLARWHGSADGDVGRLLEHYRGYLLSIANRDLPSTIKGKISASDVVQETVLRAWQDFSHFAGQSNRELAGWLRQILRNRMVDARRGIQGRSGRTAREVRLEAGSSPGRTAEFLISRGNSPSMCASSREQALRVKQALGRLNRSRRTVVVLRNREGLSFPAIARRMGRSAEASRKLWASAVEQLQGILESNAASPPGLFGPYRLLSVLSEGGMGTVYKALHVALQRVVALKIITPRLAADPCFAACFHREMVAMGAAGHPHLLRALDAGELDGKQFLVLEYVDGCDLATVVRRCGPLRVADACEVIRQAALGLDYTHRLGLVHRDVKPENLMLDRKGCVKVFDLGLALLRQGNAGSSPRRKFGSLLGTPDFMSPEQARDPQAVDCRSDLYSLGCTLYFVLSGHAPFDERWFDTRTRKILAHAVLPMRPLQQWRPDLPVALLSLAKRMLAKDPAARIGSAAAVVKELAPLTAGCRLTALVM